MRTLLFGVVPSSDLKAVEHLLSNERDSIDGLELRLDYFQKIDFQMLKSFLESCRLPVMLTVRRKDQGGAFFGSEKERLDLIEALCVLQPAYFDLEYDVPIEFRKKLFETYPEISFLSSYHDFTQTPSDIAAIYAKVKTPYTHFYKMAFTAHSSIDALHLLSFLYSHPDNEKIIGLCMGDEGQLSRILAPIGRSFLTYATLSEKASTAPGQIGANELQEIYHFRKLNSLTDIYAVIGDPIDKSLGHRVHNIVFKEAGLNAVYLRIRIKKEELSPFFKLVLKLPFKGISVTMPHKESVLPFLSQLSNETQWIRACNTIQINHQTMKGYNTDGIGALNAIEKRLCIHGRHVVVIGAGGAAKALIFEATQRGAHVTVINRNADKAIEIASSVQGTGGGFDLFPEICQRGYDVIINSTPDSDLIDERWILPGKVAMDVIYFPKNTPFLIRAAKKNCQIVYGYEMFVRQAVEQERIWFPEEIDFEKAFTLIEETVTRTLRNTIDSKS